MALTRERLEQLIARSTDIVVATDRKGTVVYYNDGASKVLGYKPDEVLGSFVSRFYPDIDEAKFQSLAKAAKEGCPVSKALSATEITLDAKLVS